MIIESGFIVAMGLLFTFWKCPWRARMWVLSRPLLTDIVVFIFLNMLHWGTFSGVMVAAVGALVTSGMISLGRKCFGYIDTKHNVYYPGIWNIVRKLT